MKLAGLTLSSLFDPATLQAAAAAPSPSCIRVADAAAAALARFIENSPEVLALLASEGLTPEQALKDLLQAADEAHAELNNANRAVRNARSEFNRRHTQVFAAARHQIDWVMRPQLEAAEKRISGAAAEREAARKKLEDAGLDAEQIAKLDIPPTQRELDELHQQAHQLRGRIATLTRFLADPRREVLGGLELGGFPVGTLPHELDAAAQAAAAGGAKHWEGR